MALFIGAKKFQKPKIKFNQKSLVGKKSVISPPKKITPVTKNRLTPGL
jgi:hypothetical protein